MYPFCEMVAKNDASEGGGLKLCLFWLVYPDES